MTNTARSFIGQFITLVSLSVATAGAIQAQEIKGKNDSDCGNPCCLQGKWIFGGGEGSISLATYHVPRVLRVCVDPNIPGVNLSIDGINDWIAAGTCKDYEGKAFRLSSAERKPSRGVYDIVR